MIRRLMEGTKELFSTLNNDSVQNATSDIRMRAGQLNQRMQQIAERAKELAEMQRARGGFGDRFELSRRGRDILNRSATGRTGDATETGQTEGTSAPARTEPVSRPQSPQPVERTPEVEAPVEATPEQRIESFEGERTTGGSRTWEWMRPQGAEFSEYNVDMSGAQGELAGGSAQVTVTAPAWTDMSEIGGQATDAEVELSVLNQETGEWVSMGTAQAGYNMEGSGLNEAVFEINDITPFLDESGQMTARLQRADGETAHVGGQQGGFRVDVSAPEAAAQQPVQEEDIVQTPVEREDPQDSPFQIEHPEGFPHGGQTPATEGGADRPLFEEVDPPEHMRPEPGAEMPIQNAPPPEEFSGSRTTGGNRQWEWNRPGGAEFSEYNVDFSGSERGVMGGQATVTINAPAWTDMSEIGGQATDAEVELTVLNQETGEWVSMGTAQAGYNMDGSGLNDAVFEIDDITPFLDESGQMTARLQRADGEAAHVGGQQGGFRVEVSAPEAAAQQPAQEEDIVQTPVEREDPQDSPFQIEHPEGFPHGGQTPVTEEGADRPLYEEFEPPEHMRPDPDNPPPENADRAQQIPRELERLQQRRVNESESDFNRRNIDIPDLPVNRGELDDMINQLDGSQPDLVNDRLRRLAEERMNADSPERTDDIRQERELEPGAGPAPVDNVDEPADAQIPAADLGDGFFSADGDIRINTGGGRSSFHEVGFETIAEDADGVASQMQVEFTVGTNVNTAELERDPNNPNILRGTAQIDVGANMEREVNIEYRTDTDEVRFTTTGRTLGGEMGDFVLDPESGEFRNEFEADFGGTQASGYNTVNPGADSPTSSVTMTNNDGTELLFENGYFAGGTGVHVEYDGNRVEMERLWGDYRMDFDNPQGMVFGEAGGRVYQYDIEAGTWSPASSHASDESPEGFNQVGEGRGINIYGGAQGFYDIEFQERQMNGEFGPTLYDVEFFINGQSQAFARLERDPNDANLFTGTVNLDVGSHVGRELQVQYRADTEEYRITTGGKNAFGEWDTFTFDSSTGQFNNFFERDFGASSASGYTTINPAGRDPVSSVTVTNESGTELNFENGFLAGGTGVYVDADGNEHQMETMWSEYRMDWSEGNAHIFGTIGEQQYRYDMETGIWNEDN